MKKEKKLLAPTEKELELEIIKYYMGLKKKKKEIIMIYCSSFTIVRLIGDLIKAKKIEPINCFHSARALKNCGKDYWDFVIK